MNVLTGRYSFESGERDLSNDDIAMISMSTARSKSWRYLHHPHLYLGASPRASLAILLASKTFAAIAGRDFVIPADVKKSVYPVLRHRIILTPEREMEGVSSDRVIDMIVQSVEVPR